MILVERGGELGMSWRCPSHSQDVIATLPASPPHLNIVRLHRVSTNFLILFRCSLSSSLHPASQFQQNRKLFSLKIALQPSRLLSTQTTLLRAFDHFPLMMAFYVGNFLASQTG